MSLQPERPEADARMRFPFAPFVALIFVIHAFPAGAQRSSDLGIVNPQSFSPTIIAVAPFEAKGEARFSQALFSEVISNDLYLSGFFDAPRNTKFVAEAEAADRRAGKVQFGEWARLGAAYIVKGEYSVVGGNLSALFRVFSTTDGRYIAGKEFREGFGQGDARALAHRISNIIIKQLSGRPGAAHANIAFIAETGIQGGKIIKEVFIMDSDGHNPRQFTKDNNLAVAPSWGANGTEIYYTSYKNRNPDLYGVYLDGSQTWMVSRQNAFNLSASWSQTLGLIALTMSRDGNSEVYLMDRRGQNLRRLTMNKAIDASPSWSPDGKKIAFTSDRTGQPHLWVMNSNGSGPRQLTRRGDYNDGAAWSPAGDKIAFTGRVKGVFQIFTIDTDGSNMRQLTSEPTDCEDPSWSPSGFVLSYTSRRSGKKAVHLMFVDGRHLAQLTRGPNAHSAEWSPLLP